MAVPVAPNFSAPVANAGAGTKHQNIKGATSISSAPSTFTPVPVGVVLKGGTTGVAYSELITAQGGTSPYTFAVTSGALPTGCSMASSGAITGTPSAASSYSFTVQVTDVNSFTGTQPFTILIADPVVSNSGFIY